MSKIREKILLLSVDLLAINLTFLFAYWLAFKSGLGGNRDPFQLSQALDVVAVISCYWLLLFAFFGLYGSWKAQSRFDESVVVGKAVTFGGLLLFILTFDIRHPLPQTRVVLFTYWALMITLVSCGRTAIRTFQRHLLIRGIGRKRSVIVGCDERGRQLLRDIHAFPALGYDVVGFAGEKPGDLIDGVMVLGEVSELPRIVSDHKVDEVLIASSNSHDETLGIIASCNGQPVALSIVPDLYDIVSGRVRTNQIYGFPLMEILPELMPAWEKKIKRLMDVVVSITILVGFAPLWVLVGLIIKLDSKGTVLFSQDRVGKDGKRFTIYKFRSMVPDAERETGPIWAERDDERVTKVGRVLRRLRLDELPQFLNILKGDMSLVGPRPERPFFVEKLKDEIPLYARRLSVQPGLTGWAQTKHNYDRSLDDVREKLKYDLYYIENMSLRMDMKILLRTIWVVLRGSGAH